MTHKTLLASAALVALITLSACGAGPRSGQVNWGLSVDNSGAPKFEVTGGFVFGEGPSIPAEGAVTEASRDMPFTLFSPAEPSGSAALEGEIEVRVHNDMQTWFRSRMGLREVPGPEHNPDIVRMHAHTSLQAQDDETPWCSSAMNAAAWSAGAMGTNSAAARSWLGWGRSVELAEALPGDVVILSRPGGTWQGHVALLVDVDASQGWIYLLGGNQSGAISVQRYRLDRLLGIRRFNG